MNACFWFKGEMKFQAVFLFCDVGFGFALLEEFFILVTGCGVVAPDWH